MKKVNLYPNNEAVNITPPETINAKEPVCLVDYMLSDNSDRIFDYSKVRSFGEDTFTMKIGGTTYEVSTHFNPNGRQCVFEQFKELILSEHLL